MTSERAKRKAARARRKAAANRQPGTSYREVAERKMGEMQSAILSVRQLYDQATQEKQHLAQQLKQRDQLISALVTEVPVQFARAQLEAVTSGEGPIGYNLDITEDEVIISAVWPEEDEDVVSG